LRLFGRNRVRINRFQDGDDLGLPRWAKHLLIGGFGDQGWNAYDQRQGGKMVATGEWGDYLDRDEITQTEAPLPGPLSDGGS
jgi:hypothetical protein